MAAKIFNDDVRLVTAIGRDYQYRETLRKFPRSNIIVTKTKSCRFEIQYDDNWRADYRKSEFGAARFLRARNVISAATGCSYVHLAPMPPEKVSAIVRGIKEKNGPSISVNSWEGYMKRKTDRKTLRDLAPLVDFFIVNEREAIQLTEVNNIAQAVRSLPAKQLVVTLGELGAIHLK